MFRLLFNLGSHVRFQVWLVSNGGVKCQGTSLRSERGEDRDVSKGLRFVSGVGEGGLSTHTVARPPAYYFRVFRIH